MTKYEQMSNLMITRPRSELAKFAKRYRISMAKEAAMIVLPIIAPGKEDTFLSKIVPSSANESEITYKVTQQLIEVYYATADQKKKKKQLQILLLSASNFTKEKLLQFVPPKIDAARKHASMKGPGQILNN